MHVVINDSFHKLSGAHNERRKREGRGEGEGEEPMHLTDNSVPITIVGTFVSIAEM